MAVPPNLIDFTRSAGVDSAAPYGVDSQLQLESEIFRAPLRRQGPVAKLRDLREYMSQGWSEMSSQLVAVADGADLIMTGTTYQEVAGNVAEYHGVPLAALHYFPFRANRHIVPFPVPDSAVRAVWPVVESAHWRLIRPAEDAQRRELGLPVSRVRAIRRMRNEVRCGLPRAPSTSHNAARVRKCVTPGPIVTSPV